MGSSSHSAVFEGQIGPVLATVADGEGDASNDTSNLLSSDKFVYSCSAYAESDKPEPGQGTSFGGSLLSEEVCEDSSTAFRGVSTSGSRKRLFRSMRSDEALPTNPENDQDFQPPQGSSESVDTRRREESGSATRIRKRIVRRGVITTGGIADPRGSTRRTCGPRVPLRDRNWV